MVCQPNLYSHARSITTLEQGTASAVSMHGNVQPGTQPQNDYHTAIATLVT